MNIISNRLTRHARTYNNERQKELLVQPPTAFGKDDDVGC